MSAGFQQISGLLPTVVPTPGEMTSVTGLSRPAHAGTVVVQLDGGLLNVPCPPKWKLAGAAYGPAIGVPSMALSV